MSTRVHTLKVSRFLIKNYNYLIVDDATRDAVLVDPAWELKTLERALEQHEAVLHSIVVTHSHFDHANLCGTLAERWQVPVYMSQVEIDHYRYRCRNLTPLYHETPFNSGAIRIIPHLTPGHTKGGICYQIDAALFTGDTLFIEGCGLCLGAGANPYDLFDSLQKLKTRLTPHTRIFPGHSYGHPCGQTLAFVLAHNLYLQFDDVEPFVAFRMRQHQNKFKWFQFQ